jgi:hypothetical protein
LSWASPTKCPVWGLKELEFVLGESYIEIQIGCCLHFHQVVGSLELFMFSISPIYSHMCMGVNRPMNMMINPKHNGFTYFSNCKVLCLWMLSIRHLNYIGDGLDFHWSTQSFKNVFKYICTQGWVKRFKFFVLTIDLCIILLDLPLKTILVFSKCGSFLNH